jgi:hypothetical protein
MIKDLWLFSHDAMESSNHPQSLSTWKRGHSSFLSLFAGFPTGFYANMVLCQEPQELPSDGFAITF